MKSVRSLDLSQVAPRKSTNTKYKKVPVDIADIVPFGIFVEGDLRSPLILIPANIPVIVGKKTPKTVNQLYPSV